MEPTDGNGSKPKVISEKARLLAEIDAFLSAHNYRESTFGREALSDPTFLPRIRNTSRSPSLEIVDRIRAWMALDQAGRDALRAARKLDDDIRRLYAQRMSWKKISEAVKQPLPVVKGRAQELGLIRPRQRERVDSRQASA